MKKLNILFELVVKFYQRYLIEYYKLMLKPIIIAIIGFLTVVITVNIPTVFTAIISLIVSIPCICYSFWKGFLITYALNIAAHNFIRKNSSITLNQCYEEAIANEKDFAMYIGFFALITIICYLPTAYYIHTLIPMSRLTGIFLNPYGIFDMVDLLTKITIVGTINTLFLLPFLNFATQAYTFRKNESYIQLFINCYKKIDFTGIILAFTATTICFLLSNFIPVIYLLTFMIINIFVYSINTFWYYSKINGDKI